MELKSDTLARTTFCALAALGMAGLTLTSAATAVQAAPLDSWRDTVNTRIDKAMEAPAQPVTGVVHVKLTVAPDGTILDHAVVSAQGSRALKQEARRVTRKLGQLPALEGAAAPVRVSMVLQYRANDADVQKIVVPSVQVAGLTR